MFLFQFNYLINYIYQNIVNMAVNPVHDEEIGPSTSSSWKIYIKRENEQCHSYEDVKQEFMNWDAEVNIIIC
jgi:hypothetical protein